MMADFDDLTPQQPRKPYEPPNLEGWAADEMRDYLEHLHAEIARVQQALEAKSSMLGAARDLFKG